MACHSVMACCFVRHGLQLMTYMTERRVATGRLYVRRREIQSWILYM